MDSPIRKSEDPFLIDLWGLIIPGTMIGFRLRHWQALKL